MNALSIPAPFFVVLPDLSHFFGSLVNPAVACAFCRIGEETWRIRVVSPAGLRHAARDRVLSECSLGREARGRTKRCNNRSDATGFLPAITTDPRSVVIAPRKRSFVLSAWTIVHQIDGRRRSHLAANPQGPSEGNCQTP